MPKPSAGLLMYRHANDKLEVFLVHPGGPLWSRKDFGAWTVPKGEYEEGEEPLEAAIREFEEETGFTSSGPMHALGQVRQKNGKLVTAWAFEGDCNPSELRSNVFTMEWPPRSGRRQEFPEVDRGAWCSLEEARQKINPGQIPLLERLEKTRK